MIEKHLSTEVWGYFFQGINTFIQQGCIKLIKSDSKDFEILFQIKKIVSQIY